MKTIPITNPNPEAVKRFWAKINKDGSTQPHMDSPCWLWTAGKFPDGYGSFRLQGRMTLAHRVAWIIENGPIPNGACILHQCDNPGCCRPSHCKPGTHSENMNDRDDKGRQARQKGSSHGRSKLTNDQVIQIREIHKAGQTTYRTLADKFNVSHSLISFIITRKLWQHI